LAADPDINVKNGAQLLDRLIKDIITENEKFDVERFIPLLQERVYVVNPNCRQFLIAWVIVLDSVPDIELLQYLPRFFDGLFNMLKDTSKDIRLEAETCLSEFLREIKETVNSKVDTNSSVRKRKPVDFGSLVKTLIVHSSSKGGY
jgi:vacuole morphology and inheritance protein 14